ncbi:metallophosphoesterase [Pedobacter gandavensis]|nr:metallophosphoesterase [Pedobacter gandavensis]
MNIKKRLFALIFFSSTALFSPDLSAQKKADQVDLLGKGSFSMVILPDPQNYVKYDYNQPVFELMTAWVAENIENLNINAVICTGDLVDQNESLIPLYPRYANISSTAQWEFVSKAFSRLDHKVPYIISPGNHDYGYTRSETDHTNFPKYFPVDRNSAWKKTLVSVCNNRKGMPTLENSAFELQNENWGKILIITSEFAPRDEVLNWAKELAASTTYANHKVIFLTHSYLTWDGKRIEKENYKISPANDGQQIWDKLLYTSKNIRLLISGHFAIPDENFEHSVGLRTDKNIAGKQVHQMMFNAQALGGGMSGNGGDGWLRLLEFQPDGKTIKIRTYSPLFGFSPTTKQFAWRKAPYDQFTLVID